MNILVCVKQIPDPATPGELAKLEQISPQSMGATLASLEARGLVQRRPDPRTAGGLSCR